MTPWVALAVAVLVALVTVLAGRGVIPMNPTVGIRTPAIMRNEQTWKAGHRAAVPVVVVTDLVVLVGFFVVNAVVPSDGSDAVNRYGLILIGVVGVGAVIAALLGSRAAKRV